MSRDLKVPEPDQDFRGYFFLVPDADKTAQQGGFKIVPHIRMLWSQRGVLALFMLAGLTLGAVFTFAIAKPLYQAQALISFRDSKNNASSLLPQQLGGLASLAGIDLGGNSQGSEELAVLSSKNMAKILVVQDRMIPILFPGNGYFLGLIKRNPPTVDMAAQQVIDKIRTVDKDKKTGLITVTMVSHDPRLAAKWTLDLINLTNAFLRERAASEAQKNIDYLQREGQSTSVDSVRQALVRLTETNLNQAMLANVQTDFAFKMVDPPEVPEKRDYIYPNNAIFLAAGLCLGLLLGILFVYWLNRRRS
jgi:uncharacterized protein involved in exopolysaccharide biosynthesis